MTDKTWWYHVSSEDNPADDASQELSHSDDSEVYRWFNGGKFMASPDIYELETEIEGDVPYDDPEVIPYSSKCNAMLSSTNTHIIVGKRVSS